MATIKDVARAAGVSTATVSYVLNRTKPVRADVEQRVLEAVKALNYRPHAAARNLRKSENCIIGYELPSFEEGDMGTLMHQFIYHLAAAAAQAGYHLMTFAPEPGNTVVASYRQLILSQRVDGFILSHTNWEDHRIEMLLEAPVPFVAFGRSRPDLQFAYVDVDGYDGMQQVAEHLIGMGHRRFAFVGWPEGSVSGDARYAGFRDTIERHGVDFDTAYERRIFNCVDEGYRVAADLMALAMPPTAIVCVSDIIAVGVMRYLSEHDWRVGHDIAVTGFDDIPLAQFLTPSLTSVRQPIEQVVERLVAILLGHIREDGTRPGRDQVLLRPSLVVRESTSFFGK